MDWLFGVQHIVQKIRSCSKWPDVEMPRPGNAPVWSLTIIRIHPFATSFHTDATRRCLYQQAFVRVLQQFTETGSMTRLLVLSFMSASDHCPGSRKPVWFLWGFLCQFTHASSISIVVSFDVHAGSHQLLSSESELHTWRKFNNVEGDPVKDCTEMSTTSSIHLGLQAKRKIDPNVELHEISISTEIFCPLLSYHSQLDHSWNMDQCHFKAYRQRWSNITSCHVANVQILHLTKTVAHV